MTEGWWLGKPRAAVYVDENPRKMIWRQNLLNLHTYVDENTCQKLLNGFRKLLFLFAEFMLSVTCVN